MVLSVVVWRGYRSVIGLFTWCLRYPYRAAVFCIVFSSNQVRRLFRIMSSCCCTCNSDSRLENQPLVTEQPAPSKCTFCEKYEDKVGRLETELDDEKHENRSLKEENKNLKKRLKEAKCQRCDTYERELQQVKQDLFCACKQNEELNKRSQEITEKMATIKEDRSDLENMNDEFSNRKIADRFKSLYGNVWASLAEWINDNVPDLGELQRISILSTLMKSGYDKCVQKAEDELRVFTGSDGPLPTKDEDPALYKSRRKYGIAKQNRETIVKEIIAIIRKEHKTIISSLHPKLERSDDDPADGENAEEEIDQKGTSEETKDDEGKGNKEIDGEQPATAKADEETSADGKVDRNQPTEDDSTKVNRQKESEGLALLESFLRTYLDCCWLMTISLHQVALDFDVKECQFSETKVKDRFMRYSCQDDVIDKTRRKDTVVEVVWPCIMLKDGTGIYAKGDVITVDVGSCCDQNDDCEDTKF